MTIISPAPGRANSGTDPVPASVMSAVHRDNDAARSRSLDELGLAVAGREERFQRVTRLASQVFGVPIAIVNVLDRDTVWIKANTGLEDAVCASRADSFCDVTVRQGTPLVVRDATADPRFAALPMVAGEPHLRFYAGVPISDDNGIVVGTLCILDTAPGTLGDAELNLLIELGDWVQSELVSSSDGDRARVVQQALLPRRLLEVKDYELAGICIPTRSVGGDYFDWGRVDNGIAVTLSDVMGKGTAAAILSASIRVAVRAASRRRAGRTRGSEGGDVSRVMREVALTLHPDLDETATMITSFFCFVDLTEHVVHWADAGHGLALILSADGRITWLSGSDLPFGVFPDQTWEERTNALAPGDGLVIFSDGLLDLLGGDGTALEEIEHLVRNAHNVSDLMLQIRALTELGVAVDDVTAVAIRRLPVDEEPTRAN